MPRHLHIALVLLGVAAATGLTCCGGDPEPAVTLTFSLDLQGALRVSPDANLRDLAAATFLVTRKRIEEYERAGARLVPRGEDRFEILLPAGMEGEVASIIDRITVLGRVEFRIVVLPWERYSAFHGGTPPRLEPGGSWPWEASAADFDAFKAKAVEEWKTARDAGLPPPPLKGGRYVLRPAFESAADSVHDFHVLESQHDRDVDFGGSILVDPVVGRDPGTGMPVVLYEVKAEYQEAFAEWTGENVGLPMAILLNEQFRSAPVINSALRDMVQITMGRGASADVEREAVELTTVLQAGALPVPLKLVSVTKHGAEQEEERPDR